MWDFFQHFFSLQIFTLVSSPSQCQYLSLKQLILPDIEATPLNSWIPSPTPACSYANFANGPRPVSRHPRLWWIHSEKENLIITFLNTQDARTRHRKHVCLSAQKRENIAKLCVLDTTINWPCMLRLWLYCLQTSFFYVISMTKLRF